jgi:hypothetical protein
MLHAAPQRRDRQRRDYECERPGANRAFLFGSRTVVQISAAQSGMNLPTVPDFAMLYADKSK